MTTPEISDLLELEVGAIAAGGGCVARAPDGKVVFVRHSLPGERVRAQVTSSTSSYLRADAVEILRPSPDRVDPPCPHAGPGRLTLDQLVDGPRRGLHHLPRHHPGQHQETALGELFNLPLVEHAHHGRSAPDA